MKKALFTLLIVALLLPAGFAHAQDAEQGRKLVVIVDGKTVNFPDAQPYIDADSNRVMAPVRFIAEALGTSVKWNDILSLVNIDNEKLHVMFKLDYTVDDLDVAYENKYKQTKMLPAALIKEDRVFIPLRFFCEYIGCTVDWDDDSSTVRISAVRPLLAFYWNPALPEGTYQLNGSSKLLKFQNPLPQGDVSEFTMGTLSQYKNKCILRVKELMERLNNVDYRTVGNSLMSEEQLITGIPEEFVKQWINTVKDNTIVKECRFETDESRVSPMMLGGFIIQGRLLFKFGQQTSAEYLNSFNEKVEDGRWYYTDIEVTYNSKLLPYYGGRGPVLHQILLDTSIKPVE